QLVEHRRLPPLIRDRNERRVGRRRLNGDLIAVVQVALKRDVARRTRPEALRLMWDRKARALVGRRVPAHEPGGLHVRGSSRPFDTSDWTSSSIALSTSL